MTLNLIKQWILLHRKTKSCHGSTTIICEFPKNTIVSAVMVLISLILFLFLFEVFSFILLSIIHQKSAISLSSLPFLFIYFLATTLFFLHMCHYFFYKEFIELNEEDLCITKTLFRQQKTLRISHSQILFWDYKESLSGGAMLEIFWIGDSPSPKKLIIGNYLSEEELEILCHKLEKGQKKTLITEN